ncbi:MAG: hypothetical protein ABIB43_04505 [archaeon]
MLKRIDSKKERRKKFWMGFVLVFLMFISMLGVLIGGGGSETWEYNDYKFTLNENNVFITKINGEKMAFNFLPQTIESINITGKIAPPLSQPMIYLTFDPDSDINNLLYIDTIRKDLQTSLNTIIINSKTKESELYLLPIIGCENATQFVPVIYLKVSNQTSVEVKDNCIILNGQTFEFFKLRDLLVYTIYGVMND